MSDVQATTHFLHLGKNIYQKTICPKAQCSLSGRFELRSFIIYAKTGFLVYLLTSKVAIYRDSLTSTIFK